jgi:hypothetical protein
MISVEIAALLWSCWGSLRISAATERANSEIAAALALMPRMSEAHALIMTTGVTAALII